MRLVWSESSVGAFWIAKDAKFLHVDNEYSDMTVQLCRLIWVHYKNMPIQIYRKFHLQKLKFFR